MAAETEVIPVTRFEWLVIIFSVMSVVLIPLLVLLFRGMVKWTRTEDKLEHVVEKLGEIGDDIKALVADKDKVHTDIRAEEIRAHTEILEQMRVDRDATNRRLRYIEEWFMKGALPSRGTP